MLQLSASKLPAAVGVPGAAGHAHPASRDRRFQGVDGQLGRHAVGDGVPHDPVRPAGPEILLGLKFGQATEPVGALRCTVNAQCLGWIGQRSGGAICSERCRPHAWFVLGLGVQYQKAHFDSPLIVKLHGRNLGVECSTVSAED